MEESGLDDTFDICPRVAPPKLTFFDLPFDVRYRVYELVGLIRTCPIDLNRRHLPTNQCYFRRCAYLCNCKPLPRGLFFVSPEVSHIFYSRNRFKICQSAPGGFRALHNLRPASLSVLTMLSIQVNRDTGYYCSVHCPFGSSSRLLWEDDMNYRDYSSTLDDWTSVCRRMAEHIQPGRLSLSVIWDTDDFETGTAFINPLKTLPTLAECSVRISQELNPQLQPLAKEAVEELTHSISMAFPFHLLPPELQILVLTHTDLVAPCTLEWTHGRGYRCRKGTQILKRCTICADVQEPCCSQLPSPSYDSQCRTCWKFPTGLFQASRAVREDALRIFYSRNHFVIPFASMSLPTGKFTSLLFLARIPVHIRKYLRSLQFSFPDGSRLDPHTEHRHELVTVVDIICAHMELSRLTLTIEINFREPRDLLFALYGTQSLDEKRTATYQLLLECLGEVRGRLKDAFVHLPLIFWDGDSRRIRAEQSLERSIMRDERYDSVARGKFKRPRSWEVEGDYDGTGELVDGNGFRSVYDIQLDGVSLFPDGFV